MSNVGQVGLTILGYGVGTALGAPSLGYIVGSLAGQALFPTKLPQLIGPRLDDSRATMARIGEPLPEIHGTDVVAGNVMYLGPVIEVAETEEVGGKGGPSQKQTTYTYFQSIGLGLCRGPMGALIRIWENGKLVYDMRPKLLTETFAEYFARVDGSLAYAEGFELYLGTSEQLPDPTIEADKGIGNVPAYRGLMYIVYTEREIVRDQGMRHPNFKFEVSEYLDVTSRVYPIEEVESMTELGIPFREGPAAAWEEYLALSGSIQSGTLRDILQTYPYYEPEFISADGSIISGELRDILRSYPYYEPEFIAASGALVSGTLDTILVSYTYYEPEFISSSGSIISGTLS